ncbi:MAG: ion transporter [Acidimicrobiales bacterium]
MEQRARRMVASPLFRHTVTGLVIAAAVLIGLEAYEETSGSYGLHIAILDMLILLAFVIEISIRFMADWRHPGQFFRRPWNVFDFLLVLGALIPLTAGFAGVLRMVRLVRIMRIVGRLPRLRMLLTTTLVSIPSLFSIMVLLGVVFYGYSAAGVFLFSENDPIHFRDPHTSFMSLFRVITLEDWTDIMYTQIYGCANYGYDAMPELCTNSQEFGAWGALFFMSFVFIGSFIVLNMFVGIILIGMDEARAQVRLEDSAAGRRPRRRTTEDVDLQRLHDRLEQVQFMVAELLDDSRDEMDVRSGGPSPEASEPDPSGALSVKERPPEGPTAGPVPVLSGSSNGGRPSRPSP